MKENIVGQKFNRLTVLAKEGGPRDHHLVRCDCGTIRRVQRSKLLAGTTKSCGCFRKEAFNQLLDRRLTMNRGTDAAAKNLFQAYERRAERREVPFTLTFEDAKTLYGSNCFYCGATPSSVRKDRSPARGEDFVYNGIDRVDPTKGYELDNVVPACWRCNSAKGSLGFEEFARWVYQIQQHGMKTDWLNAGREV